MNLKSLLVVAAATATVAQASAFKVDPVSLYPNPSLDITDSYYLENLNFCCMEEGVKITDVMPAWVDEEGNEIKAVSGQQNPFGIEPYSFVYNFDADDFKANGEYILLFPEGMLTNAAGEKSEKLEIPYTLDIPELAPAMFDDFKILSITPDFSKPQSVWNDQKITIDTNHNDAIGYTELQITDETSGESITLSTNFTEGRALGDSSPISWDVIGSFKFYQEHNYKAELTFYNGKDVVDDKGVLTKIVDRAVYEFTGLVEGYKYSSVELLSVEPAPMSFVITDPSQAVFTYTFSGPVTVYQAETPLGQNGKNVYPSSCLSSNEDKTVWTLDLSDNEYVKSIDALLTVYIYARDLDGFQLKGNWGEEGESCFQDEWECELGAFPVEIVFPAKEEVLERLTEVVVKSVGGENIEWAFGSATIQSRNREALGELYYEIDFDAPQTNEIRFTQWIPEGSFDPVPIDLAQDGVYSIVFAHACFVSGEQFDSKLSHSVSTSFEISNGIETPPSEQATFAYISVDPASGSNIASLEKIVITFPEMPAPIDFSVDVYKEGEDTPVTVADLDIDWDNELVILVNLRQPITADGVYTLTFKEGIIGNDPYAMSNGASGICNPEFKLVYTVGDGNAVGAVAADVNADVYDMQGRLVVRQASSAALKTLPKGIYIINGKKVVK